MKGIISLLLLGVCLVCLSQGYSLTIEYSGSNFFNGWDFFTGGDPTHGYVDYVSQAQAQQWGFISAGNPTYIRADSTSVSSGSGRGSVRISTQRSFNASSLIIFDLAHMPIGCGTWPAVWLVGPNWPNGGEVDIIEGVNVNVVNQATLHTSSGCTMNGVSRSQSGKGLSDDCVAADNGNSGCGVQDTRTSSYGNGFNNGGGGVYACEWTTSAIKIWFFPRNQIPGDISGGNSPNPGGWGTPVGMWPLGNNCNYNHFRDMQIVIDDTFCGDWAGNVFSSSGCGSNCQSYVQNNPKDFANAYWAINYFKVFN